MTPEILAIIPARGGSKSIPRKNILDFGGHPLIAYSIAAGLQSKHVTRTIVSTDDEEIAAVSRKYGAETPFMRPAELHAQEKLATAVPDGLHSLLFGPTLLATTGFVECVHVLALRPPVHLVVRWIPTPRIESRGPPSTAARWATRDPSRRTPNQTTDRPLQSSSSAPLIRGHRTGRQN